MLDAYVKKYLEPVGWIRSHESGCCVDCHGQPLPWYTYPGIRAIGHLAKEHHKVFEYGSGSSSLWWRARAAKVVSVEHDTEWFQNVGETAEPHRCTLIPSAAVVNQKHYDHLEEFYQAGLDPELLDDVGRNWRAGLVTRPFRSYAAEVLNYPTGYFDIIVVDGMARVLCAWLAAQQIAPHGFIVFDNSDRPMYEKGYRILNEAGFARIDFWGTGPLNPYEWCTSVFTRNLDVFR